MGVFVVREDLIIVLQLTHFNRVQEPQLLFHEFLSSHAANLKDLRVSFSILVVLLDEVQKLSLELRWW